MPQAAAGLVAVIQGLIPYQSARSAHFGVSLSSTVMPQAGAGLVADSVPDSEYEETVNKAAALGRAIDLAEQAFVDC